MHLLDRVAWRLERPLRILVALGLVTLGLWLAISTVHDRHESTTWGTFTASSCSWHGRQGNQCIGRWVSDDGRLVLPEAYLSERVAVGTPVRTGVTTTGWLTSLDEQEVFTRRRAWPWIGVGLALFGGGGWRLRHLPPCGEPPLDERRDTSEADAPPRRAL